MESSPDPNGRQVSRGQSALLVSPAVIVLVAAIIRLVGWAAGLAYPESFAGGDTADYWLLAEDPVRSYAATDGLLYELGLRRPPGYPVLVALSRLIGGGMAGAALLQSLYAVATVAATVAFARRLVGIREAAVAGWWLALDPLHVVESSILLTEIPFSLAMLLAAFAVWKALQAPNARIRWWGAAGVMLAVATLIRPISFYLPPLAFIVVVLAGRRRIGWTPAFAGALVLLISFALPAGAWMARNRLVSGVATISTIQGASLAMYRAPGALLEGRGVPLAESRSRLDSIVAARLPPDASPAERGRVRERVGIEVILSEPVGYTISAAKGLVRTLFGPGGAHIQARMLGLPGGQLLGVVFTALSAGSAFAASLLMMVGFGIWARRSAWTTLLLIAVPILYLLAVSSGPEAYSRFRLQFLPFILVTSATAAIAIVNWIRARRRATRP
jgi:4-amino-4-deoxy-L-arabinose transferase-like glycosyltransferase